MPNIRNKILLVEDDSIVASVLSHSLKNEGYATVHASSGEEAIQFCTSNIELIDIILMDINLGSGIDGTVAAEQILKKYQIPLIFVSSHTEKEIVQKIEKITSFGYVLKNSGITVLDASIKMAFKLFDANKELMEEKEHLRTTLNSIGDAVIATDAEGIIIRMNPVAEKLTGWNFQDARGISISKVFKVIDIKTRQDAVSSFEKVIKTEIGIVPANHVLLLSKEGNETQISDSGSLIKDTNGNILGVVLVFRDVTEEYRMQEALRESEANLQKAQEIAKIGSWIYYFSGDFSWSDEMYSLCNVSSEKFIPNRETFINLIHSDDRSVVQEWIDSYSKGLKTGSLKFRITLSNGTIRYILSLGELIFDSNGKSVYITGTAQDITERELAEIAINESNQLFSKIFYSSPTAVALTRISDEKFVQVNDSFLELSGYSLNEIIGRTPDELGVFNTTKWTDGKLNKSDLLPYFEVKINKKSGEVRDGLVSFGTVVIKGEKYALSNCLDITERKNAEARLFENELKLKTILENILDGVLIINKEGIIQYANASTETIFGYEVSELLGKNINVLMPMPFKEEYGNYLSNYLQTGKKKIIGIGKEAVGLRKNGNSFPIELSISEWKFNNEIFFTGTIKDISYKKSVEEHLKQSQKLEALGLISGGIAHDFNNILAILMGNLELIARKLPEDNPSLLKKVQTSLNAVERGSQLTKKLLAFARKQIFSPEVFDLNVIINDMFEILERVLGKQIHIELEISESPLKILIDKNEMENVILNFAINARDAMENSGTLTIRTKRVENVKLPLENSDISDRIFAELAIMDTGGGIPQNIMQKIFEPFFTTKPKDKGTGLGLSLAYGFVKQSNGHIHVYSEEGKGTCFRLYFPVVDSDVTEVITQTDILPVRESLDENVKNKNILVVDDELSMLNIANSILSEIGYNVLTAENAADALGMLKTNKIDLVLSDIIMPGEMNGIALAKFIRQNFTGTKIILTSGFPGHLHKKEADELRQYIFIEKPYKMKDLESIVISELNDKIQ